MQKKGKKSTNDGKFKLTIRQTIEEENCIVSNVKRKMKLECVIFFLWDQYLQLSAQRFS